MAPQHKGEHKGYISGMEPIGNGSLSSRIRRFFIGPPRDLGDTSIFHKLALIPILAWIGLGADGLSSSSYGPQEAFRTLGEHAYLAIGLAAMTILTVFVISMAYSHIIELFPHGGGGYVVATKLLGRRAGVLSGCALLVDYVLTITTSIAAAGDALFSFVPGGTEFKLPLEILLIVGLITLNLRGVKESVLALAPIFILFLVTHVILIGGGILGHVTSIPVVTQSVSSGFQSGLTTLGVGGMLLLFLHAYSLGGGTYTGIEAVSNGLMIMREPRVHTGKRTMLYMAVSLALTAGGLLVCYLLWNVGYVEGKTLNAVLAERMASGLPFAGLFVVLTLLSEGALLVVAAQAGFIDGPRVLSNMAHDSWVPRRFGALSDRLTTANGVFLMGAASLAALVYAKGSVSHLVVMYSINVFLTFSLSMFGMVRHWVAVRKEDRRWKGRLALFGFGALLCVTILIVTTLEKFEEGGWITLVVTASFIALCFLIHRHYREVGKKLSQLYSELDLLPPAPVRATAAGLDPSHPTAGVLVSEYSGLGIYTLQKILTMFPGHYKNVVFLSIAVVDSGGFKGEGAVERLRQHKEKMLAKYVALGERLGVPSISRLAIGTDAVAEAVKLCAEVAQEFPKAIFFGGKIVFQHESWFQRILHNETANTIQKRLQFQGLTMVVLPAKVH